MSRLQTLSRLRNVDPKTGTFRTSAAACANPAAPVAVHDITRLRVLAPAGLQHDWLNSLTPAISPKSA